MVRRLVEDHHVGLGQQELGQHQPVLLAAAQGSHRLIERFAAETQAVEHALQAMVDVVGVLLVQLVLEVIVAGGQPLLLGRITGGGHVGRHFQRLLLQGHEVGQRAEGLIVQGAIGREMRLLFQVAQPRGRMDLARAGIGLVFAGENPQERGLAAAVGTNQADAVARADLEGDAAQDRLRSELPSDARHIQQNHSGTL